MNAIEINEEVTAVGAQLAVEGDHVVVQGGSLPAGLQEEVDRHQMQIMIALGAPAESTIVSILEELRPHLSPSLSALSDDKLLRLVRWAMVTSWNGGLRDIERRGAPASDAPIQKRGGR